MPTTIFQLRPLQEDNKTLKEESVKIVLLGENQYQVLWENRSCEEIIQGVEGKPPLVTTPNSHTFNSLQEALDSSPPLQKFWGPISISSNLPLSLIEDKILNIWGPWAINNPPNPPNPPNAKTITEKKTPRTPETSGVVKINGIYYHRSFPKPLPPKDLIEGAEADHINDTVGIMLRNLGRMTKNSREYKDYKEAVVKEMKKQDYESWDGDSRDYGGLNVSGMSIIYSVPENRRGHLLKYRGQTVRVCCVGAGDYSVRRHMVGPIGRELKVTSTFAFLNELRVKNSKNIPLLLAIAQRDYKSVQDSFENKHCNASEIDDNTIWELASEGRVDLLRLLSKEGIDLSDPTDTVGGKIKQCWHTTLFKLSKHHPHKVPELLKLYSEKALKELAQRGDGGDAIYKELPKMVKAELKRRQSLLIRSKVATHSLELS